MMMSWFVLGTSSAQVQLLSTGRYEKEPGRPYVTRRRAHNRVGCRVPLGRRKRHVLATPIASWRIPLKLQD